MITANINKIIRFSNVDGPGNRLAIFFQECNFNCLYCHNPETINICSNCNLCIDICPTSSLSKGDIKPIWNEKSCIDCDECIKICPHTSSPKYKNYSVNDIVNIITPVSPFISGITVSGGEATLNFEFITALFKEFKLKFPNLTCFIDTNGSLDLSETKYKELVRYTDYFMLDIKMWDNNSHILLTSHKNNSVIKNLKYLLT